MSGWRSCLAGAAGVLLALPAAPLITTAAPAAAAVAPTAVPCPSAKPPTPVRRPPLPTPPPLDPAARSVGGAALDTAGLVAPVGAPAPPALTATSWLVADLDTGAVLGGCGPHEHATPASVQKLLLAAAAIGRLDRTQRVRVLREDLDFEPGSSAVGLLANGRYTVETLWLGLLLNSGNDAANVLARLAGGDAGRAGGVAAMNAEARRLGALQTRAVTPSGLDGPGQFTSAYDLALIFRKCFGNADFRRYARTERTRMPAQPPRDPRGFEIQNDNQLLFEYPGALGGKTGFTDLARHTYVGAAERDGRRLVVTLLGAEARPLRGWQQGAALLDWGFKLPRDAAVGRLVEPGEVAGAVGSQTTEGTPAADPVVPRPAGGAPGDLAAPSRLDQRLGGWVTGVAASLAAAFAAAPLLLLYLARGRRPRRRRH